MKELGQLLAERASELRGATYFCKIKLNDQPCPARSTESKGLASRGSLIQTIRDIAVLYSLEWLLRQETKSEIGCMKQLTNDELISLYEKMHRARECLIEGIPFDDAGLIKMIDHGRTEHG